MKIMIVVGARPNFMKAAPVVFAIHDHNASVAALPGVSQTDSAEQIQLVLVHTGQHYDEAMSGSFFSDLGLPKPDVHLEVGSGSHAAQTAEIMRRFEAVILEKKPDLVMVFGDVNSTVACALVTSKIVLDSSGKRPLIAHVEAGLRSFDRAMPEEINRVITDHLSDLLFVTEESGKENLCREGIKPEKIHFVGNTMIDSLRASEEKAGKSAILDQFGLRGASNGSVKRYALLTLHRPSNVDDRETFLSILEGLDELAGSCPILFSAHPRTRKRIAEFGLERFFQAGNEQSGNETGIRLLDPLGYFDFLCLMKHAALVVTDSGGIQEETTCLKVPCVTVRENTERPVTVTCGTNVIAGTNSENIRRAVKDQLSGKKQGRVPEKWDGQAAGRIVQTIVQEFRESEPSADSSATISRGASVSDAG
ncbi:MAG TPA: UDP-N-acetylglucosamine 2-epimerase (non-hydrolyzing) [Candidatus Sulfotelmatobacter sp.]|nr:UDP-N-acetylglucosamine 2-epimerase (non-hydrolyzing) [Candidatus Sulfotelmatobacter sp.]